MLKNMKAAMFGIDARVTLAIFAGLSLATGTFLMGVIQDLKVKKEIVEFEKINKAISNFELDTKRKLLLFNSTSANYITAPLLSESVFDKFPYWNGPYLKDYENLGGLLLRGKDLTVGLAELKNTNWSALSMTNKCSSGDTCIKWLQVSYILDDSKNLNFIKLMDIEIDGSDSPDSGNFRYDLSSQECFYKMKLFIKK